MPKKKKASRKKIAAIDFETYWSSKYTIKGISTYQYVHHPEFDAFLTSIYCPHMEYVGNPADFEWSRLDGYTLLAHNAGFDQRVFERLQEQGVIPQGLNLTWICTADMCAYFQYQRTLKGASKHALGVELSKEVRDNMKNKTWNDIVAEDTAKATLQYAMDDAKYCYELYAKLYDEWPEVERRVSQLTRGMAYRGLPAHEGTIDKGIDDLERLLFEAKNRLPWYDEIDPDTKKVYAVYSKKALALECRKAGIPVPKSLDRRDKDWHAWNDEYGMVLKFPADMQAVQRIKKHLATLRSMQARLTPEHRISYNLKYFGAGVTGRWSGTGGLNVQNLPRDPQYGVNLRNCITAPKGKLLAVVDLAQIEARITAWFAGNWDFLNLVSEGVSPYEAHARQSMGWTGGDLKKEDPELYMLAKVRVLQLGYGCGWHKFWETVKAYGQLHLLEEPFERVDEIRFVQWAKAYSPPQAAMYPSLTKLERQHWVNAKIQVDDFRDKNKDIKDMWDSYGVALNEAAGNGDDYAVTLPSGRVLHLYRCRYEVQNGSSQIMAATQLGGIFRQKTYGANLFQNTVQGCARDLFAYHLYSLDAAGYEVVLHVHDEVVVIVDEKAADASLEAIVNIMSTVPEWAKGVPVAAEGILTKEYTK